MNSKLEQQNQTDFSLKFNTFFIEGMDKVGKTTFINKLKEKLATKKQIVQGSKRNIAVDVGDNVIFGHLPTFMFFDRPKVDHINEFNSFIGFLQDIELSVEKFLSCKAGYNKTILFICDRSPLSTIVYNRVNFPRHLPYTALTCMLKYSHVCSKVFGNSGIVFYIDPPQGYPVKGDSKDEYDEYNFIRHKEVEYVYENIILREFNYRNHCLFRSSDMEYTIEEFADRIIELSKNENFADEFYNSIACDKKINKDLR